MQLISIFLKNADAVSPIIGVVLTVVITVMIAALVAVFGFSFGATESKGPTAAITVENAPDTIGVADLKIQHKGGDRLVGGDWSLSIVPVGQPPVYQRSLTDLKVGDQIMTMNVTNHPNAVYNVTNSVVNITAGDDPAVTRLVAGQKYDVKIIVYPFKNMVLDTVVEVR
ncbi:Protein of unknown function (DUF1628) [Candidatus Methanoperedens nitroreducens]|uniref:Archaeal Type IV pilin N-terminal domain-containing protein n=1 Tax=Candidatus Methanoperedens nitratireducens TaxID=1392998 RepID=A0A062V3A4_9EURY|nr:type IV pilin N-terminal domain-containing protein [Candidatus Methanoperedens nitroreducens]KCZ70304.1 Protein of unknown function (DUF1628) [Candidatus Methanoperedens nitroreducens]MDJ1421341.1 type IV pilin N-terminal domain-containing protein [Candidatus Methanoperedens sp.]